MFYDDGGLEEEPIRITEPLNSDPYWFGNEIVIEDANGELHSYTLEEWHEILLFDGETIEYLFGFSHTDIIDALYYAGYWDDEDWEEWRENYAAIHGV